MSMTRMVTYKNGLNIISDNIFYVVEMDSPDGKQLVLPDGVSRFRDGYRAIVNLKSYDSDTRDIIGYGAKTPAQQLIFRDYSIKWTETVTMNGEDHHFNEERQLVKLSAWAYEWLTKNVSSQYTYWDFRSYCRPHEAPIFFRRRKDALSFVRAINSTIAKFEFSKY